MKTARAARCYRTAARWRRIARRIIARSAIWRKAKANGESN
jgi:hypothetical protein